MNIFTAITLLACLCALQSSADIVKSIKTVVKIGQREVCKIKKSCVECLRLTHCSWCKTDNKCFSNEMEPETCKNETNEYMDFGFSLQENAECGCQENEIKDNCYPAEAEQETALPCSGRGRCVCGRCICETYENSTKDTAACPAKFTPGTGEQQLHQPFGATFDPSKTPNMVMGDYCEFDNFSCDGPRCNEGPYSLNNPVDQEE